VLTSIVGTNLETVTEVSFSGSGVRAQILRPPSANRVDVAISIAADAAPGPRAILLPATQGGTGEGQFSGALFYVLARSSYAGTGGIGSHLI
jgi:hypothetical protein